jgi:hypothetical protein
MLRTEGLPKTGRGDEEVFGAPSLVVFVGVEVGRFALGAAAEVRTVGVFCAPAFALSSLALSRFASPFGLGVAVAEEAGASVFADPFFASLFFSSLFVAAVGLLTGASSSAGPSRVCACADAARGALSASPMTNANKTLLIMHSTFLQFRRSARWPGQWPLEKSPRQNFPCSQGGEAAFVVFSSAGQVGGRKRASRPLD